MPSPQPLSYRDYIARHKLLLRYGMGLGIAAMAAASGLVIGGTPAIIVIKGMIGALFAIGTSAVPALFDPHTSRQPYSPSFVERTLLETLLLSLFVSCIIWQPLIDPVRLLLSTGASFAIILALSLGLAWRRRHR